MKTSVKNLFLLPVLVTGLGFLVAGPATVQAQFTYVTNNGRITITGYIGPGGAVTIPSTIDGLPVASIGYEAFDENTTLASVTIGTNLTYIGEFAFSFCTSLTNLTLPGSVTTFGIGAFDGCSSLTSITIPRSVTLFDYDVVSLQFGNCTNLTSVFFQGNAPIADSTVFRGANSNVTVYYLPGTIGWGTDFSGVPMTLWTLPYPLILNNTPAFGLQSNQFSFTVSWATNLSVVIEASPDLGNLKWSPVTTNALSGGIFNFSDPQWTNYPNRFYRVRSQ
jgi:hypothetical protein